jgi:hypothetical protein
VSLVLVDFDEERTNGRPRPCSVVDASLRMLLDGPKNLELWPIEFKYDRQCPRIILTPVAVPQDHQRLESRFYSDRIHISCINGHGPQNLLLTVSLGR